MASGNRQRRRSIRSQRHQPRQRVPADRRTRQLRCQVHEAIDGLWMHSAHQHRNRAAVYAWLAHRMGLKRRDCHVRLFDAGQCRHSLALLEDITLPQIHQELQRAGIEVARLRSA